MLIKMTKIYEDSNMKNIKYNFAMAFMMFSLLSPSTSNASERCKEVSSELIHGISEKLISKNAYAVKSDNHENLYFVAAKSINSNKTGAWVTNALEYGSGMIFSVNDFALEISPWGDGRTTAFKASQKDSAYSAAINCVELGIE